MPESTFPGGRAFALPVGLRVASAICWIWALALAFVGLVVFTLGFHAVPAYRDPVLLVTLFLLTIAYCYSAYGLRKGSRVAASIAIGISALMSFATLLGVAHGRRFAFIGVLVNLTILVL